MAISSMRVLSTSMDSPSTSKRTTFPSFLLMSRTMRYSCGKMLEMGVSDAPEDAPKWKAKTEPKEAQTPDPKPMRAEDVVPEVKEKPVIIPAHPMRTTLEKKHLFIASSADVIGEVRVGNDVSIWYNAVVRGDELPITIGDRSNVQDGSVVHVAPGYKTTIGSGVTIGHNCTIHGCTIGDDVLVGMGSVILNGAAIGKNCIIGAGSLVTQNKEIPEGSLVMGSPAKVVRPLSPEEIQGILDNAREYVALMDEEPGRSYYEDVNGILTLN